MEIMRARGSEGGGVRILVLVLQVGNTATQQLHPNSKKVLLICIMYYLLVTSLFSSIILPIRKISYTLQNFFFHWNCSGVQYL
jgi:hypothetical protein